MILRYADPDLTRLCSNLHKYGEWQNVELAVLEARSEVGEITPDNFTQVRDFLNLQPIDENWLDKEEKLSNHDYNAFIAERRRHLPKRLQRLFHGEMTSYDGEEPATSRIMKGTFDLTIGRIEGLEVALMSQIRKHRFTPRLERTHGRGAELQSVGRFLITLLTPLAQCRENVVIARNGFDYSKLSGAIGAGGGLKPEVQRLALAKLGLLPFNGATQIMPRTFHAGAASALAILASWLAKMAFDLWLGSRDPYPLFEEPFRPKQKGSSAMPWKKNPITLEKVRGMARWARACAMAIMENIETPEGRDISQSSVERLAWPDLLHTVIHLLSSMTKVVDGLNVYVDNLARQIAEMRETFAGSKAKELLAEWLEGKLDAEAVYRVVQLAGFNVLEPTYAAAEYRISGPPESLEEADKWTQRVCVQVRKPKVQYEPESFRHVIMTGALRPSPLLDISTEAVSSWNQMLCELFQDQEKRRCWNEIFKVSYWLKNEEDQFERVLGK
ncbi:MAG: lyase family protein [Candidatus Taylorbacteria bacterium]